MPDPRPLNVRVADALGTMHVLGPVIGKDGERNIRRCTHHKDETYAYDFMTDYDGRVLAPPYDTEWSAGGPLIERLHVDLSWLSGSEWTATVWIPNPSPRLNRRSSGPSPLVALCNLILSLEHDGLLKEVLAAAAAA